MTRKQGGNFQVWTKSNESCPEGTIPIRRTTEQDLLRASSIERFGRKLSPISKTDEGGHEHAIARTKGTFRGGKAFFNVWKPKVENSDEFSLTQMWVVVGTYENHDLNSVEAGWQRDAYEKTGCYNLLCEGFVQFSSKILVGGSITPVSTYNGQQFGIDLHIWKDADAWWLEVEGETVGYWPSSIFTLLWSSKDTIVDFGGEVFIGRMPSSGHTTTEMGSGHFPSEGFKKAAFIRNMQVVDENGALIPAPISKVIIDSNTCYNMEVHLPTKDPIWGTFIYHGGPGKSSICPLERF
ncbi:uncharacterized protein LOC127264846 [Andrographis paniculata]|uniref:uncharacterized protein LOC127264846 n=1 Tax=Andrographis paniculata TaxID=175694 RepID=UPI0021E736EB|nr:uncharacterized protein LOC127264846 [Andrographis paniculata]